MKTKFYYSMVISVFPLIAPLAHGQADRPAGSSAIAGTVEEGVGHGWRASEIIGIDVKNATDEVIGEIKDLLVDFKSGEILAAVVSSGGFLGLGDSLSTVPLSSLRYDQRAEAFKTKLTKEQLQGAPRYTDETWMEHRATIGDKVRAYRDSIASGSSVAPLAQGDNDADMKISKDIRAGIESANLSSEAKDIKVTTRGGMVVLTGVVKNEPERKTVVEIAAKHADRAKVTDQLVVGDPE